MKNDIKQKIKKIKLLALDVDGVLTNGTINLDEKGRELKVFNVQDGFGLVLLKRCGLKTAIISARSCGAVTARAKDLKIDKVYQDAYPKLKAYRELLKELKLKDEQVCFVGDDLPDMCVFKKVGLSVAVANAAKEAKQMADYVTKKNGGAGAVREVVELILKTQGKWKEVLETMERGSR